MLGFILLGAHASPVPHEFYDYVNRPDSTYEYRITESRPGKQTIQLTSQIWQGKPWRHTVLLQQPGTPRPDGTAILYITGDGPRPGDYTDVGIMSVATGMPVAMLFDIPNQPLWDMKEDDLIAHTFEQYLTTKDPTWPLLFPMAKSAIRAMDAIVDATKATPNPITKFVVTGASKRGWTTWFVGATGDPRVVGIAPMVYDNLNILAQMPHQLQQWGAYSEQIQDYTRRGLQAKLNSSEGRHLAEIVDPFSYRSKIKVPILVVKGANDPYWAADATSLYWDGLKQRKWLVSVPNAGHGLGDKIRAVETIGAFSRSLAGEFPMPEPKVTWSYRKGEFQARVQSKETPVAVKVWVAAAETTDFRPAKYIALDASSGKAQLDQGEGRNLAAFVEVRYRAGGREFGLCSPTRLYTR
jgi:PhoPQ-activated pathogenicity-related protein